MIYIHVLVYLTYDFQLRHENQVLFSRDFKNIDFNLLHDTFGFLNWDYSYFLPSTDDQHEYLKSNVSILLDSSVPIIMKKVTLKKKPWLPHKFSPI